LYLPHGLHRIGAFSTPNPAELLIGGELNAARTTSKGHLVQTVENDYHENSMAWHEVASSAVVGALFVYFCIHRADRIQDFFFAPNLNWRVPVFDVTVFLLGAALFTIFVIEPSTRKEAFLAGATWEGAASGLLTRANNT